MNQFDASLMAVLGALTNRSEFFDVLVLYVKGSDLFKGGGVVAVIWWLWLADGPRARRTREILIVTLMGAVGAVTAARTLALTTPFRFRPKHDPNLDYPLPMGTLPGELDGWSSFPSDHGALFFALAVGVLLVSRRVGYAMLAYVTVMIAIPRIYTGMHYPTDILAGAGLGVACVLVCYRWRRALLIPELAMRWLDAHSASFHAALFLFTFQVATLFDGARGLAGFTYRGAKILLK